MTKKSSVSALMFLIYAACVCLVLAYFEYEKAGYFNDSGSASVAQLRPKAKVKPELKPEHKSKPASAVTAKPQAKAVSSSKLTPPKFAEISDIPTRKAAFFKYFGEIAAIENAKTAELRKSVVDISNTLDQGKQLQSAQLKQLKALRKAYRVDEDEVDKRKVLNTLLRRVDEIPPALVLIQAAIESGWGTSRFAVEANNYFGQWCFSKGCGVVPSGRTKGKKHEIRRFSSPAGSLRAYMHNLNTYYPYAEFRTFRATLRAKGGLSGLALADGLMSYSERGQDYIDQVKGMIRASGLESE